MGTLTCGCGHHHLALLVQASQGPTHRFMYPFKSDKSVTETYNFFDDPVEEFNGQCYGCLVYQKPHGSIQK
ncbi:hypothetical protein AVEN_223468-1 [Araneus ventricosus]|uniref:Uncharacterized protein n=1 Tax=Araneus ventricosus TaxID=182803 RepID=A0A4Y2EXS5_ARAVE|nr:hypothetical protein AVEN_223468-1 [Araneus ventricosus]